MAHFQHARSTTVAVVLLSVMLLAVNGCSRSDKKAKYLSSARAFQKQGKLSSAVLQYRNALQADPQFQEARLGLAGALLQEGDAAGAKRELETLIAAAPANGDAHLLLARIYLLAQQPKAAREQAQLILAKDPKSVKAQVLIASTQMAEKDFAGAEKTLQSALLEDKTSVDAWLGLAYSQIAQKQLSDAEKSLAEAAAADPSSVIPLLAQAAFLERQNRLAEAEQALTQASHIDPNNVAVLLAAASYYSRHNEDANVVAALQHLQNLSQSHDRNRLLLAQYYIDKHDNDQAVATLQALIKSDGTNGPAAERLGTLWIETGKLSLADSLARQALKDDKKSVVGNYLEARIKLTNGDASAAIDYLHRAAGYMPKTAALYHYEGVARLMQKDENLARSAFSQAIALQPDYAPSRVARGKLELAHNETKAAMDDAVIAVKSSHTVDSWLLYINALLQNGDEKKAEALLQQLIRMQGSPNTRAAFRAREALLELQHADYNAGRKDLVALESDIPQSTWPEQMIATSYLYQRNFQQAEQVIDAAREHSPESIDLWLTQAHIFEQQKKYPEAMALLSQLSGKYKDNEAVNWELANVAALQQDWKSAAAQFEEIGRVHKSAMAMAQAGQAQEHTGDLAQAQQDYEAAIKLQPDDVVALNNLSFLLLSQGGNVDVALKDAQRAKELRPDSPEISDTLAWAYYHMHRYEFAIGLLQESIRSKPTSALYRYHLAKCYMAMNDRAQARQLMTEALHQSGDFPRADAIRDLKNLEAAR